MLRAQFVCCVLVVTATGGAAAGALPVAGGEALRAASDERVAEDEGLGLTEGGSSEQWLGGAGEGGSGGDGASTVFAESAAAVSTAAAGDRDREWRGDEDERASHVGPSAMRRALSEKSRRVAELEAELRQRDSVASLSSGSDAAQPRQVPAGYMPSSADADRGAMKPFVVSRAQGGDEPSEGYVDPVIVPSLASGSGSGPSSSAGSSVDSGSGDAARPSAARNDMAASRCGARRGIDWLVRHHLDLDLASRADNDLMFELMFVAGRSADEVVEQVEVVSNALRRLQRLRTRLRKVARRKAASGSKEEEEEEEVKVARDRADEEAIRIATERAEARDRHLARDAEGRERKEAVGRRRQAQREKREQREREEALEEEQRAEAAMEKAKREAKRRLDVARTEAQLEKEQALEAFEHAKERAQHGE